MSSVNFYPHIGGIESVTEYLADEFFKMGNEVVVLTMTNEIGDRSFPYEVLRTPSKLQILEKYIWCDVFVHQGISLKFIFPVFLFKKPWFVVHHMASNKKGLLSKVKKWVTHFSHNIAVSEIVAKGLRLPNCTIIHNSYNSNFFYNYENGKPRDGFVYVGKLWKTKGVYLLLDAFEIYKNETGSKSRLSLIGGGDDNMVRQYASRLTCHEDVEFLGFQSPENICNILNTKRIQIVPSIGEEAFGIVVLEGMACGCIIIGSDNCGISEAMGDAGYKFCRGDVVDLVDKMKQASSLTMDEYEIQLIKNLKQLECLSLSKVAHRYIECFQKEL